MSTILGPDGALPPLGDFHHGDGDYGLRIHGPQWDVFECPTRYRVLAAGRRFGKTELAVMEILRTAALGKQNIWYVAPSVDLAKDIMWDRLKEATEAFWARPPWEGQCRIELLNGTRITVKGAHKPENLRGRGLDLIVLDEFADVPATAWRRVLRPALMDRQGRALFLGTPVGRNHFYDCFERGKIEGDAEWRSFQFKTAEAGIIDEKELESAAADLDRNAYRQELEAEFGTVGLHQVYSAFERAVNVKPVDFDPTKPLIWSLDFNVDPMCMLLMQGDDKTGIVQVFDEIVIKPNATTEAACKAFLDKALPLTKKVSYLHVPLQVKIYGDSSGRQRRTSSNDTDWAIIHSFFRMWVGTFKPVMMIPEANPFVRDRVNAVNARLRNQHGENRLFIDPKCVELIRDLEEVSWELDAAGNSTGEICKKDHRRTHMSDALGYYIVKQYPVRLPGGHQPNPLPYY